MEKHDIAYHEKTLGQLFCDGSSKQIIQMLLDECGAGGVELRLNSEVTDVKKHEAGFSLRANGENITANKLVVATGGPSIPKMGATGWGYDLAEQFGLNVVEPRPALVPFTLNEVMLEKLKPLSGVSVEVAAACNGTSFNEGMLFTHRGLSGPAILQISSYWNPGDSVRLNMAPDEEVFAWLKLKREESPKQDIHIALAQLLPKRVAQYVCEECGASGALAELSNKSMQAIAEHVNRWSVVPGGTEGYRTAEVTLGGVDTGELSSKTFECKKVSGLYFIGEVVDVTGHLGGFNFQWAWASGWAAGQGL